MFGVRGLAEVLLLLGIGLQHALTLPTDIQTDAEFDVADFNETSQPFEDFPKVLKARQNAKVDLRILPIGASIMEGTGSTYHSGLRKPLRMALRYDGFRVNMVGTRQHGSDMTDRDHDATGGAKLSNIPTFIERSKGYKPNIVIINVGTNNANDNDGVDSSYQAMLDIVDSIWKAPDMSDTCVFLSTILPTDHGTGRVHRLTINNHYRNVVTKRAGDGKCIYLVDTEPGGAGKDFMGINMPIWSDSPKVHPNDEGHRRFAYIFYAAIHRAVAAGKVKAPKAMSVGGSKTCDKTPGNGIFVSGTQKGSGSGDGIYYHKAEDPKTVIEMSSAWDRDQWRFARLWNTRYDDMLGWIDKGNNVHQAGVWKNSADGQGNFNNVGDLDYKLYCIPRGLRFADVNGDGLDDAICISPTGDLHASINNGDGSGSKLPTFTYKGQIKSGEAPQARIRLGDIDGDGRVDYGIVQDNGNVKWVRNGGNGDTPAFWQGLGVRAQIAMPENDIAGIRFEDINGDGRADWMWMSQAGRTTTWTNTRSCAKGKDGDGLNVAWRQAFYSGSSSGPTHGGVAYMQPKAEDWRTRIHFARIYGTKPAFGNLGVQDYVVITPKKNSETSYDFKVQVFKNAGSGGTKLEADGNRYCNMHGHASGQMDYAWVWSTGRIDVHKNADGKTSLSPGEAYWSGLAENVWSPPGGAQVDRRNIQLADWDGDGACDIIWVDESKNNQIRVFLNNYPRTKSWANAFYETTAPNLQCKERNGIGFQDVAVRFADITGSGKADYLCIAKDGLIRANLRGADGSPGALNQIKFGEGADRANLRFADVNGDKKADMIWVDKFNGGAKVWYSEGANSNPSGNGGSYWSWRNGGKAYDGSWAGSCQHFPDLDGNGRADLHSIRGTWTNDAESWFSPSCGLRDVEGDDPEGVVNPQLPVQPGNAIGGPAPDLPPGGTPELELPEKSPDWPKGDWTEVPCTHPDMKDATRSSAADRWDNLKAPAAWNEAVRAYARDRGSTKITFTEWIMNYFHGPQNMACGSLEVANSCSQTLQCNNFEVDGSGPAGLFIHTSFVRLNSLLKNFREALQLTHTKMTSDSNKFAIIFAPAKPEKINGAQIADIILVGWGALAAPIWNKAFAKVLWSTKHQNTFNTLKDFTNDGVSNSITTVKDWLDLSDDALGRSADWQAKIGDMVVQWRGALEALTKFYFSGTDSAINQLTKILDNGKMIELFLSSDSQDPKDYQQSLWQSTEKVMYGLLIPYAWRGIVPTRFTFLANLDVGCGKLKDHYQYDKSWDGNSVCRDGKEYLIFTAEEPWSNCNIPTNPELPRNCQGFEIAPGWNAFGGTAWGGITREDLVAGALATFNDHGKSNNRPKPKDTEVSKSQDRAKKILDLDVRAPGVVWLPVCTYEEAWRNYWNAAQSNGKDWKYNEFPCNKEDD